MLIFKLYELYVVRLWGLLLSSVLAPVFILYTSERNHYSPYHWLINEHSPQHEFTSDVLLLDVRSAKDYAHAHVPSALSLDPQDWDTTFPIFLERWSPERPVVIYCGGQACGLSKEIALKLLMDLPDADISVLKGGFPAWQAYEAKRKESL